MARSGVRGWVDRQLAAMGYVKAARGAAPITSLFRGEAPPYYDTFRRFTPADWERLAVTSSWIYSDVNLIAATFTSARLQIHQWQGEDLAEVPNHPFERLMTRPNAAMGRSYLWQYTLWWLLLRGEAYWWNVYDRGGDLAELWPIPADRMEPIPDPKTYIRGYAYRYSDGSDVIELPTQSVTYFRLPNPFDFHRGMSPLSACRLGLQIDQTAQQWNLDQFQKGAPLRMIVTVPQDVSPENFEKFKADIREQFEAGVQYLIGRAGSLDAKAIGLAPADLQFLAGREFTREEIDRVYGIPAGFWAKEATRANSDAAEAVLLEKTVMPLHCLCSEQVTVQTLPAYGDDTLEARFEDIRKEDRELVIREREVNWQVFTVNEARAELGLDDLEDPLLGATLVPLATKNAPPGGAFGGGLPAVNEPEGVPEFKADLRLWRGLALRRFREGKGLDYDFQSEFIPHEVKAGILGALSVATTEEEVKSAFDRTAIAGRAWGGWQFYG